MTAMLNLEEKFPRLGNRKIGNKTPSSNFRTSMHKCIQDKLELNKITRKVKLSFQFPFQVTKETKTVVKQMI